MGSSRKHKDKEREKDRDLKRRRHRSRSKERERDYRSDRSQRESRDSRDIRHGRYDRGDQNKKRPRDYDDKGPPEKIRAKDDVRIVDDETTPKVSGGGDVSLSIQETNKLRAKLGLKPLEAKDGSSTQSESGDTKKDEFVHKPAEDLTSKRFVEKLREKVMVQRQKREIIQKLSTVKGLTESDSEDDASNWVEKSRQIENEKKKAEEREKLLKEMDEEFGIGNIVEDEFKDMKSKAYTGKDLRGLTVEHAKTTFAEGKLTILTLKDKGVLDDDGDDVLVNVNMVDDERAAKNVEVKKGKPTYNPYEGEGTDEFGKLVDKTLLAKYDEEIDGEKKKSFTIGLSGKVGTETEREIIRQKLMQQQGVVSLDMPALKQANEYYTDEEMVKFKKPMKKIRKVRKKIKPLKADELLRMSGETQPSTSSNSDLGSRGKQKAGRKTPESLESTKHLSEPTDSQSEAMDMDIDDKCYVDDETEILGPEEDLEGVSVEPDEAELELHFALNKARKLKQKEDRKTGIDMIVKTMRSSEEIDDGDLKGSIVLNSTAEFCRALGDIPTYGMSGNREDGVEDLMDYDEELYGKDKIKGDDDEEEEDENKGAWNEVEAANPSVKIKKEEVTILDEEPDVGTGIAGALQLAMKKGYLEKEIKKVVSAPRHSNLEATSYTIEDKNFLEDDRQGRRERYAAGPVTDFRDKDGYKPDIKLEYIDDGGRLLKPKEAFRYLSHKFHGKGSGKNKTEKRMKKLQEESLMKRMSSTDTPLGTLALLQDKQRQTQSPYIVLSGGNKAINSSVISKTGK